MTYPRQLGVFPLPNVVLFPHVRLPLHVFEPRYRRLVDDCLKADGRLVIATLRPGYEPDYFGCPECHPVACAGRIVECEPRADGCSDIIVCGERVVEVREFVSARPYRVARLDPARPEASPPEMGAQCVTELRNLINRCCPGTYEKLQNQLAASPDEDGGLELLNTLASSFPVQVERKLAWLRCADPAERWQAMRTTLLHVAEEARRCDDTIRQYSDRRPETPGFN